MADVQARLRALGHEVSDETGLYGESTAAAVRAFQQARAISVDGIVGPDTWTELVEASWRLGDRTLYLRRPMLRGDDVAELQRRLNALGFDAGREDGIFGDATARALKGFQREYGVPEDGIFGPLTHSALRGLRVDRPGLSAVLREELRWSRVELDGALVVIDPGHGPGDPGEVSPRGRSESELCWDLAVRVAHHLAEAGAGVRLTRTEAENPDASERARRANDLDAHAFVSLHLNHHDEPTAEGASTYYFMGSRLGEWLADNILAALVGAGAANCRSHPRRTRILRETRMPAVIVEPAFISNPDEAKRLEDADHREALSAAIAGGIRLHFEGWKPG